MADGASKIHRFIAIDWSAKSGLSPAKPSKDAIWASKSRITKAQPKAAYFRSRAECIQYVKQEIREAKNAGERVLIGFDFAFGYPAGYLQALGVVGGWRKLIAHLSGLVQDEENENNRFEVADTLNARLGGGQGPLWGHPAGRRFKHLRPKKGSFPYRTQTGQLEEFRLVDLGLRSKGVQPIWKICYTASVGGQTLVGLPYLNRLATDKDVGKHLVIWPFDTGLAADPYASRPGIVAAIVEIWPGIMPIHQRYKSGIRDEGQVKTISEFMKHSAATGEIRHYFNPPGISAAENLRRITKEEGWIFGAT